MIVVLKHNPNPEQLQSLITWLQEKGIIIHTSIGEGNMLLGLVGDTSKIDADLISALDIVEDVKRVQEPYKNANRKFHPEDTVVKVGNTQIGGGNLTLMAGPCSVESEEQVVAIAKAVKASGATMLRGGAFKPRTSPYSFQGLRRGRPALPRDRQGGDGAAHRHRADGPSASFRSSRMWTSFRSARAICRTSIF